MRKATAEIIREYGPFPGATKAAGVTYDGRSVWFATGETLRAFDPETGETQREIAVPAHAGSAFDGRYLYQLAGAVIQKVDPANGDVVSTISAPGPGTHSGLAWAEGALWVGQYKERRIHQIDPDTGAVLRTIESNRFVTGVTWVAGELWHGTSEEGESELRRIDAQSGEVLETLEMPTGITVSGLESDGEDRFFCGGGGNPVVRVVRRPRRAGG